MQKSFSFNLECDSRTPIITSHALDQYCSRRQLPAHVCRNQAVIAWQYGIRHGETRGELNRYISAIYLRYRRANNVRISQGTVWVYCGRVLVTCWCLPSRYHRYVRSAVRRRQLAAVIGVAA